MKKTLLRILSLVFCLIIAFPVFTLPVSAASEKTITYDYYFEADSPEDLSYSADQDEIEVDGKHYRLKDVQCDLYSEPVKETKHIKGNSKTADPYITKTVEGTEIKLYAPTKIKWQDNSVTYTKEYATEAEIPDRIEYEGRELTLRAKDPVSRTDRVTATAKFYSSSPDTDVYKFNGKEVTLKGGKPIWNGYKKDYADYLGVSGSKVYQITGSKWNGNIRKSGSGYVRTATVYGTKKVNYYIATYELSNDSDRYEADITYTSKYIGHAKVTYERYITTKQKLVYAGLGIGLLALLAGGILFLLKKKKDETEDEDGLPVLD